MALCEKKRNYTYYEMMNLSNNHILVSTLQPIHTQICQLSDLQSQDLGERHPSDNIKYAKDKKKKKNIST